eukprot:TRINITY_DN29885_c0_g1_i1.p1 TRINITY_DN29885_c0_g1~~TRINITY_DN29885_c0_g1_i1.p1  ORF type:complete len:651 (-),score=141.12 TRINITY_DN29885_c0_g1_i1:659-2611(-)
MADKDGPPRAFSRNKQAAAATEVDGSQLLLSHLSVPDEVDPIIQEGTSADLDTFLQAVDKLHASIAVFERHRHLNSCEGALRRARQLITLAMQSLQEDFYEMLGSSSGFVDPAEMREHLTARMNIDDSESLPSPTEAVLSTLLFSDAVPALHSMAERLTFNGCGPQCAKAYRDRRSSAVQRNFVRLGVEKLGREEIHSMPWEQLDAKIREWIEHVQIGVLLLLPGERKICDQILEGLDPFRERCFSEIGGNALQNFLLPFADAVAEGKKSPEKLFALLDMHKTLKDLMPQVDAMFDGTLGLPARKAVTSVLKSLGSAAQATLEEFELLVEQNETETASSQTQESEQGQQKQKRPSLLSRLIKGRSIEDGSSVFDDDMDGQRTGLRSSRSSSGDRGGGLAGGSPRAASAPPRSFLTDGAVHPLTSYVVNYVKLLTNGELPYVSTLNSIFVESIRQQDGSTTSAKLSSALCSIMLALSKNLQFKVKPQKDFSLQELFLMNNEAYMVNSLSMADAGEILSANWLRRLRQSMEEHQANYLLAVRAKFEHVLLEEKADATAFSRRVKAFNQEFSDLAERQARMVVVDVKRRADMRQELQAYFKEAYGAFLKANQDLLDGPKGVALRQQVRSREEVERVLGEAFLLAARTGAPKPS